MKRLSIRQACGLDEVLPYEGVMDAPQIKKLLGHIISQEQFDALKSSVHVEWVRDAGIPTHLPDRRKYTVMVKGWGDMSVYMLLV